MGLRGFADDHPVLILIILLVGVIGAVAALSAIFVQGSILGGEGCDFDPVNVSGQQFSSVDDFRQAVQNNGGDFTAINSTVIFRTREGVLEYKIKDCESEGVERIDPQ